MIFVFLLVLLIPFAIIAGLFGIAVQSVWSALLFLVKYLLPGAIVGFVVAIKKGVRDVYDDPPYAKYALIGAIINLVLLIICLQFPANPEFPKTEEVSSVYASYATLQDEESGDSTEDVELIDALCRQLNENEYSYTIKEFVKIEEDTSEYTVEFTTKDGEKITCIFCSDQVVAVKKGIFTIYYEVDDDSGEVPRSDAFRIINYEAEKKREEERQATMAIISPFAEEFLESIIYVEDESLEFVIPETLPTIDYSITIDMEGTDVKPGEDYVLQNFDVYKDHQQNDTWEPGGRYRIDLKGVRFKKFKISVTPSYDQNYTLDVLKLLPKEKILK